MPTGENEAAEEEINRFLRANRVLDVESQFVSNANGSYWSFCVKYILRTEQNQKSQNRYENKTDYRAILDEGTFAVFSKLRECRKKIAMEEAIPAYAVFTDAELAEIAKLPVINQKTILSIKGIGEKKAERFGSKLIEMFQKLSNETHGKAD